MNIAMDGPIRSLFLLFVVATCTAANVSEVSAEEAQWIWKNGSRVGVDVPQGEVCLFRKPINLRKRRPGELKSQPTMNTKSS